MAGGLPTKADKQAYAERMLASLRRRVLAKLDALPEDWDGLEVSQFIADHAAMYALTFKHARNAYMRDRRDAYRAAVQERGLLE